MSAVDPTPAAAPWRAGVHAARQLVGPGLALQAVAVGLVLAYYFVPAAQPWFAQLMAWRNAGGFAFSALASALCGGLLPFLYLRALPGTRAANPWPHLLFFVAFWAWKGAEVDLQYRTWALVFGRMPSFATVAPKVLCDQFLYNPLWAAPSANLCFAWKDAGFRWAPVLADVRRGRWYARSVLPVLIPTWAVWIPVVCCVYALPPALQVPLFNIVLCFWSLLYVHVVTREVERETTPAMPA
ncbi:MAG TPA: hypothetical protein VHD61_09915 [Lacunisphaera sp.]|nr:hypothetical protein [Lacunisphaera sp.]